MGLAAAAGCEDGLMMRRGATLIELLVATGIGCVLVSLTLGGVGKARATAARAVCQDHLRQIGLAAQNYHAAKGRLPAGLDRPADPMPYSTWLTRLLPFVDQAAAWQQAVADYKRQPAFWAPFRHAMATEVMPAFLCPVAGPAKGTTEDGQEAAYTSYLGVSGSQPAGTKANGVLYRASAIRLADIADGSANTLLAGERPVSASRHFGWWYAGIGQLEDGSADSVMSVRETNRTHREPTCPDGPYHFRSGSDTARCAMFHYWSNHPGGANFAFCDGSVRFLRYEAAPSSPPWPPGPAGSPSSARTDAP